MYKIGKGLMCAMVVFFGILLVLQVIFPKSEGFDVTMYGAKKNKPSGSKCEFDPECASNTCLHFSSSDGPRFTCK